MVYGESRLVNTLSGPVVDTLLATPFALVTVAAGLGSFDMNQKLVARSLGQRSRP